VDLIEELRKMMNFEYELYEAKDGLYGQMDSKTEWNGMIRNLFVYLFAQNTCKTRLNL
jgi:glutamate receptor, ionotropic, invertebrate